MAFSHGKDTKVYASGYDLTSYLNQATTTSTADLADASVFGTTYKAFVAGLLDGRMTFSGYYDGSANAVDQVLAGLQANDIRLTVIPQGDTQGQRGQAMYGVEINYEISTGIDGVASISMEAASKTGVEPIIVNTIKAARGTSGNDATGVDGTAQTTNGWSAFLHVFAVTGSSATLDVKLQDSTDNSAWLDVTGGAFTQVLQAGVPTSQRIVSASGATLRRYTRFLWTLGGSTPNFTFWAGHVRK